jgi:hypothetical protein
MDKVKAIRNFCSIVFLFLMLALPVFSADPPQTQWTKSFRSDIGTYQMGRDIRQTFDGGFIIAGSVSYWGIKYIGNTFIHYLYSHIYLIRTDKLGNLVWQKYYKNSDNEEAYAVQQTSDGGFLVVGWTTSFGAGEGDVYLMKVDAAGNFLWHKTYGGARSDSATCLEETFDGGYIIAGSSTSFNVAGNLSSSSSATYSDFYLIRTDAAGNLLWQQTYGGAGRDDAWSVQQTWDGGFIIAGDTESYGAGATDVYLVKTNATGGFLWQKTFGGTGYDHGRSVQQTYDGGYVVAGELSLGSTNSSIYLVKSDGAGSLLWQKQFGETGSNGANAVIQTLDGGLAIAAYESVSGKSLTRTDKLGAIRWQTQFDSDSRPISFNAVRQTFDRGFIATGTDLSTVALVKFAPENSRVSDDHRR